MTSSTGPSPLGTLWLSAFQKGNNGDIVLWDSNQQNFGYQPSVNHCTSLAWFKLCNVLDFILLPTQCRLIFLSIQCLSVNQFGHFYGVYLCSSCHFVGNEEAIWSPVKLECNILTCDIFIQYFNYAIIDNSNMSQPPRWFESRTCKQLPCYASVKQVLIPGAFW